MFTIQRTIHAIKGDNLKWIFWELCPFFDLDFLSSITDWWLSLLTLYLTAKLWTGLNWKHLQTINYMRLKNRNLFWDGLKHCGKRRKCWFQHFLLFSQCFQKASFLGSLKSGLCGKELKGHMPGLPLTIVLLWLRRKAAGSFGRMSYWELVKRTPGSMDRCTRLLQYNWDSVENGIVTILNTLA